MLCLVDGTLMRDGRSIVEHVNLELNRGELTVLIGPNGAGKSSMMSVLSGELSLTAGEVLLDDVPVSSYGASALAERLAVLEQNDLLDFPFLVREVVAMGRIPHGNTALDVARIVDEVNETLGLGHLSERTYTTLSGGEKRRVQIARVLCQIWDRLPDACLMLDEPTGPLDLAHEMVVLELLHTLTRRGLTALLVMHDINLAARCADHIGLLHETKFEVGAPAEMITASSLAAAFGIAADVQIMAQAPQIRLHSERF
ncbi:MAG: hypothetical protein CMQ05_19005 [Gammaproteobacteria bacterium]|nr:hypothetical protein [Gammaproteobacteria bacterium]MAV28166.1 hypothetical protein [Gammaproteobacteria bacterium]RPG23078.1 MAG: ATP-binding cassette domain-containing protein [Gammaproteobacteria bacterium TMED50]|tara:strand:- start:3468 stop:4238 length:771 start_codon:yes stop_codon:yes gene_type:complete